MPHGNKHQVFGPCGFVTLSEGMLLVTLQDLDQHRRVLKAVHWCEDVEAS